MSATIPSPRTAPPRRRRPGYSRGTAPLMPQRPTLPCAATPTAGKAWGQRPSPVSPFERSGRTFNKTHLTYGTVVPDAGDHVTHDDDWMCDDGSFDSKDSGLLNLEEVRKSSWFKDFLTWLGELNPEVVTDPAVEVLCPACKRGPEGALLYRGFQQLLDHASSIRAKSVWLHQRFAEILEEELKNRWQGLGWPPIAVDLNTGLGKQEVSDKGGLWDCFSHGHCGASSSVLGYHRTERSYDRLKQGERNYGWHTENLWKQQTTEKHVPCGYKTTKEEKLDMFSTHYGDKQKLKYRMKLDQITVGDHPEEKCGIIQKVALLKREIRKEIEQKNLDRKLRQRDLEIETTMRMLTEQSTEHKKEIESLNEQCKKLCNKLKESEMARLKMQKQLVLLHVQLVMIMENLMNTGDGKHDIMDNEQSADH